MPRRTNNSARAAASEVNSASSFIEPEEEDEIFRPNPNPPVAHSPILGAHNPINPPHTTSDSAITTAS